MGWTTCAHCKERFGLDDATEATLRRSGAGFHCPWGHELVFNPGKTDLQLLQEQLDEERRQRQRAEQAVAREQDWRLDAERRAEHERHRANGYKGHATRITKRAKAGVCPCCNRSFENLRRHMATKHPTFTPIELEVIEGGKRA